MPINIHTPSVAISASTSSASGAIPNSSSTQIRVVNGTTAVAYINAGGSGVAATNANIAVAPYGVEILERQLGSDTHVAALLSTGSGIVTISPA
jgi:hypothetical protein